MRAASAAHIHFHLIPRRPDDPLELRGPSVFERLRGAYERPTDPDLEAEAERISAAVRDTLLVTSTSEQS